MTRSSHLPPSYTAHGMVPLNAHTERSAILKLSRYGVILTTGLWLLFELAHAGPICGCEHRYDLLMELYDATSGPQWTNKKGWGTISPCSTDWYGVTCALGDITVVSLSSNSLRGTLPASWSGMPRLQILILALNSLSGTLPSPWSSMSSLQELFLDSNSLSGTLPASWSSLSSPQILNLASNSLSGTLPASWSSLSSLQILILDSNSLSGTLPASWSSLSSLQQLVLYSNSLIGELPSPWSSMSSLQELFLDSNSLRGTVPASWSSMSSLQILILDSNSLSGTLPASWSSLSSLQQLVLHSNSLIGELPSPWSSMSSLQHLHLNSNRLTGMLPASWSSLSSLQHLHLNSNRLTGTLPAAWINMKSLKVLMLEINCLIGDLPEIPPNRMPLLSIHVCQTRIVSTSTSCAVSETWPPYCDATRSLSLASGTSSHTISEEAPSHSGSIGASGTVAANSTRSLFLTCSAVTASPTLSTDDFSSIADHRSAAWELLVVATSVTSVVGAVSGSDGGSAQVLLLTVDSPCVCGNAARPLPPPKGLTTLCPAFLLGGDAIDPALAVWGNVALAAALFALQLAVVICVRWRRNPAVANNTMPMWLPAAAAVHFPSASIKAALFLCPGVVSGVVWMYVYSPAPAPSSESNMKEPVGQQVGWTVLAVLYVIALGLLLECVVRRKWIVDTKHGLRFVPFRQRNVFSPPIPPLLARFLCSRDGVWGPPDARTSFGSPVATSFRPQFYRWAWAVGPVCSLLLVILNTVRPPAESAGPLCDGIQAVALVVLCVATLLFGMVQPHRAIAASLLCSLGHFTNALATLLGLLCRHGVVERETVVEVVVVGSYVVLGGRVVTFGFEQWEKRLLSRSCVIREASGNRATCAAMQASPRAQGSRRLAAPLLAVAAPSLEINREVTLRLLVEMVCEGSLHRE